MSSSLAAVIAALAAFVSLVAVSYHSRQRNRMKRNKEILDRYNPERSKKPLGL